MMSSVLAITFCYYVVFHGNTIEVVKQTPCW